MFGDNSCCAEAAFGEQFAKNGETDDRVRVQAFRSPIAACHNSYSSVRLVDGVVDKRSGVNNITDISHLQIMHVHKFNCTVVDPNRFGRPVVAVHARTDSC